MNTNRISFVDVDQSSYLSTDTDIIGFTVVTAPRGSAEPMYFPKGATDKLLARLGAPHKDFPGLKEIFDFNANYSVYVSAPPGTKVGLYNYYGGIYITTEKSVEYFHEVTDPDNPNFNIQVTATNNSSAFSEGTTKTYASQIITIDEIKDEYFTLSALGTFTITYPSLADPTVLTTVEMTLTGTDLYVGANLVGSIVDNLDGTFKIDIVGNPLVPDLDLTLGGALDTYLSVPANFASLNVIWELNIESFVVFTLFQKTPMNDITTFSISKVDLEPTVGIPPVTNPYYNSMTFSFIQPLYASKSYSSGDITVSTDPEALDGFNSSLYFEDILENNIYIGAHAYRQFTDIPAPWTIATDIVRPVTGNRVILDPSIDSTDIQTTLQEGWDEAKDPIYEDVQIFFDAMAYDALKTSMISIKTSYTPFSTFVMPVRVGSIDADSAVTDLTALRSTLPVYKGSMSYLVNEFLVKELYNGTEYYTFPSGMYAVMLGQIMERKLGGAAPMFTNEDNLGGQLAISVKKQKYKFSADHLDTLDDLGYNPIILDPFYGVMVTSQKTSASPSVLTDWSYLGHSMAFDLFKREIKNNVMIPQIGKAIDNYHMQLRKDQCVSILNRRLSGATAIWDSGIVLVQEVNTPETKAQNKFVIKIRVKVNPFSEFVELIFNNVGQNVEIA